MDRRRLSWTSVLLLGFIVFGAFLLWRGAIKPADSGRFMRWQPGTYGILTFLDGDTVVADMQGTPETIRFIGIDTPETHKPDTPVQCYGPDAASYTKRRIGSQRIRLVADTLTTNRDRYGRLLRYVYLEDGTNLNEELVRKGYAFAYAFPFAKSQDFHEAMKSARDNERGLWGECKPYQNPVTGQWHTPDAVTH